MKKSVTALILAALLLLSLAGCGGQDMVALKCSRCGKKAKTTKIYKASKVSIARKYRTVAYKGGNTETTKVTVKNSKNKTISKAYYDLSFDNNYATGIGTVTVTFKGNYSGTKTLTYKIKGIPTQL